MGNCSRRTASPSRVEAMSHVGSSKPSVQSSTIYEPLDFVGIVHRLQAYVWYLGLVTWLLVPLYCLSQLLVPPIQPTCSKGFDNLTLIGVALYEAFYIYSEGVAWVSTRQLLAPPEITILRGYGVLRKRRRYVALGIIESLDLYTDVCFPFIAHACSAHLTSRFRQTWLIVPVIGEFVASVVDVIRFWGICLMFASLNVFVSGFWGLYHMHVTHNHVETTVLASNSTKRISGETFFYWAMAAETANLPSVGMLSEEIAAINKFRYDDTKDTVEVAEARDKAKHGKGTMEAAILAETVRAEEEAKVNAAGNRHYILVMLVKVIVGNAFQLWMQSSFFGLTFDVTGHEARVKIIISMLLSTITALVRVKMIVPKTGALGMLLAGLTVFLVVWSAAKIYFAYKCESHVWNLSSFSCVDIKAFDGSS
mmetsp:Transcript_22787/g.41452  ORF Transcript_22787/g.41452 Transcript_22787/m.41452 type:complete len:423 (+) Transcript_22787:92-1360(+)